MLSIIQDIAMRVCPVGSYAQHQTHGAVEVIGAKGWLREIMYQTFDNEDFYQPTYDVKWVQLNEFISLNPEHFDFE